jgi:transcriptional regulator of arginine metabolism
MNKEVHGSTLRRRDEIVRLVREHAVKSQEGLLGLLRGRGFRVAQPTLSRDLTELRVAKTSRGYVVPPADLEIEEEPAELAGERLDRALRDYALSADAAGSLVVLRTPPAEANAMARAIDAARLPEVVGTVAGDDTIFIATPSGAAARRLKSRLLEPVNPSASAEAMAEKLRGKSRPSSRRRRG